MTTTARLGMPMIQPGQAQKEFYHNEALMVADAAIQASVVAIGIDAPPAGAATGNCWIVGAQPTGAWAGRAHAIAAWTGNGWRFVTAREGMAAWDVTNRMAVRFVDGGWERGALRGGRLVLGGVQVVGTRGAAIAGPAGGTVVDAQARAGVEAILATLRTHGLIAP